MMFNDRVFIIAEAGVNHNGSLETARALVDVASQAGADAVKFQTFTAAGIASRSAEMADYQKRASGDSGSQYEMLKRLELGESDHRALAAYCTKKDILFLSSPFDEQAVDLLLEVGVPLLKVGSGEITNLPLLVYIGSKKLPVILSTGMSMLGEVERAVAVLNGEGCRDIALLHCVTEYPAPVDQVNLKAMLTLRQAFGLPVGYSDHTVGFEIPVAAVALGATILEKHFTLDKSMKGPDHAASLDPGELTLMVRAVRNVEQALGDGIKRPAPCELGNRDVARKSLIAARALAAGETLRREDIAVKRPGSGIAPKYLQRVVGRVLKTDVGADEVLRWEQLS